MARHVRKAEPVPDRAPQARSRACPAAGLPRSNAHGLYRLVQILAVRYTRSVNLETDAAALRALAHPVRLGIMRRLAETPETCACDFTEFFGVAQPTISQHLKVLRQAGLVRTRRRGTQNLLLDRPRRHYRGRRDHSRATAPRRGRHRLTRPGRPRSQPAPAGSACRHDPHRRPGPAAPHRGGQEAGQRSRKTPSCDPGRIRNPSTPARARRSSSCSIPDRDEPNSGGNHHKHLRAPLETACAGRAPITCTPTGRTSGPRRPGQGDPVALDDQVRAGKILYQNNQICASQTINAKGPQPGQSGGSARGYQPGFA